MLLARWVDPWEYSSSTESKRKSQMTTKTAKYNVAMVAAITAAASAAEAKGEKLNAASALEILSDPAFDGSDVSQRGVIAKIRSMNLPYAKAEKVTKSGEPVMTKEVMADQIATALGLSDLKSLAKAEKDDLRTLLNVVHEIVGFQTDKAVNG